jgi:uncharacterized UBP type Zn finger protein
MDEKQRAAAWKHISKDTCPHFKVLRNRLTSEKARCEKCGLGESLRLCLLCGYVACCESLGAHDTEHWRETGHALIGPQRTAYDWVWCYECNAFLD